jgi:membrane protein YqaA with SNARE-associated domain
MTPSDWSLIAGTFLFCIGSAVIPLMHAEAYLITVSALTPPALSVALVLAATAGQMIGKVAMYWAGRGALRIPSERWKRRVDAVHARYEGHQGFGNGLIFLSSATGLPPFYVIAIAAGVLRVPLGAFIIFGSAGRLLRFAVAVFLPQLIKGWLA